MASDRKRLGISLAVTGLVCGVAVLMLGRGPLLRAAARSGDVLGAKMLLVLGTDPDAADPDGTTPVTLATVYSSPGVVRVLLAHGADPKRANRALQLAVAQGKEETVVLLLEAGVDVDAACDGLTPLQLAADWGHADVVAHLIASGADVNATGSLGVTPLMYAADAGSADAVDLLLAAGADVDARDERKGTALRVAAGSLCSRCVELLLAAGADANAQDDEGWTPLHQAAAYGDGKTANLLLDHGADVALKDQYPADYPARRGHVLGTRLGPVPVHPARQLRLAQALQAVGLRRPGSR